MVEKKEKSLLFHLSRNPALSLSLSPRIEKMNGLAAIPNYDNCNNDPIVSARLIAKATKAKKCNAGLISRLVIGIGHLTSNW